MGQAILISNNEVLNSLYELNLRVYVDTNVKVVNEYNQAIDLVSNSKTDLVICNIDNSDKSMGLNSFIEFSKTSNLPIIFLGKKFDSNQIISIANRYDIKTILQTVAKILNITAKDMAQKSMPEFFSIPMGLLKMMDMAPCDIFYRTPVDDTKNKFNYFKIIDNKTENKSKIIKYIEQGIEELFIESSERLKFINKASILIIEDLKRDDILNSERIEVTSKGLIVVAEEIFDNPIVTNTIAEISRTCIKSINNIIAENPKLKVLLGNFIHVQNEYIFMRTVISTFIASGIIKNLSWGSVDQIEKISFALFYHDIYLVNIFRKYPGTFFEEDLLYQEGIEDQEKEIVMNHAKMAAQLVATFPKAPMGVDSIVIQHHGMINGEGFAVNFKDDISPLTKIMIIAEDIATNIICDFYDKKLSKQRVLDKTMIQKRLLEKFKNHTYKKIIEAFFKITF